MVVTKQDLILQLVMVREAFHQAHKAQNIPLKELLDKQFSIMVKLGKAKFPGFSVAPISSSLKKPLVEGFPAATDTDFLLFPPELEEFQMFLEEEEEYCLNDEDYELLGLSPEIEKAKRLQIEREDKELVLKRKVLEAKRKERVDFLIGEYEKSWGIDLEKKKRTKRELKLKMVDIVKLKDLVDDVVDGVVDIVFDGCLEECVDEAVDSIDNWVVKDLLDELVAKVSREDEVIEEAIETAAMKLLFGIYPNLIDEVVGEVKEGSEVDNKELDEESGSEKEANEAKIDIEAETEVDDGDADDIVIVDDDDDGTGSRVDDSRYGDVLIVNDDWAAGKIRHPLTKIQRREKKRPSAGVCQVCNKHVSWLRRHLTNVHKFTPLDFASQKKQKKKNPVRRCPIFGCETYLTRFDSHWAKIHKITKAGNKERYDQLIRLLRVQKKKDEL